MWNTNPSLSAIEPAFYIDTERKVIVNQRSVDPFHYRKYFNTGFTRRRPDISEEEFQSWVDRFGESEKLKNQMASYISREIERTGYLTSGSESHWMHPLSDQLSRVSPAFTGLLNFNTQLSWEDMSKSVNWYDGIMDRINKYGLRYPLDDSPIENVIIQDKAIVLKKRQDDIKALMLREMGVNWSLLK